MVLQSQVESYFNIKQSYVCQPYPISFLWNDGLLRNFFKKVLLMAIFLFLILLCIDIVKDTLTKSVDNAFGYVTIPNYFKSKNTKVIIISLLIITIAVSMKLITRTGISGFMAYYFTGGLFVFILCIYFLLNHSRKSKFLTLNILRFWVFVGIIAMLLNGIEGKL